MPGESWIRPPEEWQELVTKLLSLKFGIGEFVPIPDTVRGDCGLEGFTRGGKGFQCYAAEEPLTTGELTRNRKRKSRVTLRSLTNTRPSWRASRADRAQRVDTCRSPLEDKALLAHAEEKMKSLRTAGLSFISPTIVPGICTGENFIVERQQLVQAGKESLRIAVALVDQAKITDWVAANDELVRNWTRKRWRFGTKIRPLRDSFGTSQFAIISMARTRSQNCKQTTQTSSRRWTELKRTRSIFSSPNPSRPPHYHLTTGERLAIHWKRNSPELCVGLIGSQ